MSALTSHRVKPLAGLALLLLATCAWLLLNRADGNSAIAQAPSAAQTKVSQSESLTAAADPGVLGGDSVFSASLAAAKASQLGAKVPLPAGSDFSEILWEDATALGPVSEGDVEGYLEYNAACKWWSAAYANASDRLAAAIVQDIPQWPTFRDGDRHLTAEAVAEGGDALLNAALYCDQSSRRAAAIRAQRGA